MLRAQVNLSLSTVLTLIRAFGLGEPHPVLEDLLSPDENEQDARQLAYGELGNFGLLPDGEPDPDLLHALHIISAADREYYGRITTARGGYAVLTASRNRVGALLLRDGDRVFLGPASADNLVDTLIAQLPELHPAHGPSVTLSAHDQQDTGKLQLKELNRILGLPRSGGGELHAAIRDSAGRRRIAPFGLDYLDSTEGRWLHYRNVDNWIIAAPATPQLLAAKIMELANIR
ncbi:ESX secretion-associated protein EspG [Pseudonocardiaceae bacterium YIM PH 21723]|nr:ESX secretion-associated protein EspG [Pseudonocardiaceae bacterium YIM PH 21723]